jgi:hypothetical protein
MITNPIEFKPNTPLQPRRACLTMTVAVLASLLTGNASLQAQPIFVPNSSFESQSGVGYPFGANPNVDAWQKISEPAYYAPAFGNAVPPWSATAGVFVGTAPNSPNPYANLLGTQAGYLLAFPQVTLFQDYDSAPTHDFNATFEIGKAYTLTIGLFGSSLLFPGSTLELSLYYRDNLNQKVAVGSTIVTYSAAAFPNTPVLNLIDYSVNVPMVRAGDPFAGKNIGIQLASTVPIELTSGRNWDFDNVRLTATVPEPATMTLLGLGLVGLLTARSRRPA